MHFIFDLDHTVIDSSHRQLTDINGSLDLNHWRENCTREKIMRDSLLPLASIMRQAIELDLHVIICTARVLSEHDIEFLREHGLFTGDILSRAEGDCSGDDTLKVRLLQDYAQSLGMSWAGFTRHAYMWDDNVKVLSTLKTHGVATMCAITANKRLKAVNS